MNNKLQLTKLGDVLTDFTKKNKNDDPITVFSVTNGGGFTISSEYFSKEVFSSNLKTYKIVEEGDFAYNPSRINVGSIDYFKNSGKGLVSPLYVTFKAKDCIDPSYLKYFLKSASGNSQIRNNTSGSVRDTLSFKQLSRIQVPLLPLEDQKRIVKILDEADALRQKRKQTIELLDEYLKSVFLNMFGNPVKNPKGWKMMKLGEISESRLGKMRDKQYITGKHLKQYLGNSNVKWFHFDFSNLLEMDFDEQEQAKYSMNYGDLLICEGGDIGRCAIWKDKLKDCFFQKALHRVRTNKKMIIPEYLQWVLWFYSKENAFKESRSQATIAHITGIKLKRLSIPVARIDLQNEFAEIIEKTESVKQTMLSQSEELENQFQALMQKAFKGQL